MHPQILPASHFHLDPLSVTSVLTNNFARNCRTIQYFLNLFHYSKNFAMLSSRCHAMQITRDISNKGFVGELEDRMLFHKKK